MFDSTKYSNILKLNYVLYITLKAPTQFVTEGEAGQAPANVYFSDIFICEEPVKNKRRSFRNAGLRRTYRWRSDYPAQY